MGKGIGLERPRQFGANGSGLRRRATRDTTENSGQPFLGPKVYPGKGRGNKTGPLNLAHTGNGWAPGILRPGFKGWPRKIGSPGRQLRPRKVTQQAGIWPGQLGTQKECLLLWKTLGSPGSGICAPKNFSPNPGVWKEKPPVKIFPTERSGSLRPRDIWGAHRVHKSWRPVTSDRLAPLVSPRPQEDIGSLVFNKWGPRQNVGHTGHIRGWRPPYKILGPPGSRGWPRLKSPQAGVSQRSHRPILGTRETKVGSLTKIVPPRCEDVLWPPKIFVRPERKCRPQRNFWCTQRQRWATENQTS